MMFSKWRKKTTQFSGRLDYRCRIALHLQNDFVKGGFAVHLDP